MSKRSGDLNFLGGIPGLGFVENNVVEGGVAVYSGSAPVNVVFHGHQKRFSYDYYGIHVGTEDRLTFVGDSSRKFLAEFIDCRLGSETWGLRHSCHISPSTSVHLSIPPGVAHIFSGLESIYTINSFTNYLPEPDDWVSGITNWSISADTVNIRRDADPSEIPKLKVNTHAASRLFYELTCKGIEEALDGMAIEYPITQKVMMDDGTPKVLRFRKRAKETDKPAEKTLGKHRHAVHKRRLFVTGSDGEESGYTVMNGGDDLFVGPNVQSLVEKCNHDVRRERRLTFFGDNNRELYVETRMGEVVDVFPIHPTPFFDLVIKPHVVVKVKGECEAVAFR